MKNQLTITRGMLFKFLKDLDENKVDIRPDGFNNTIHWHVGHLLVSAESFMFGYPKKSQIFSTKLHEWFATGTRPIDWVGKVPSVKELITLLEEQTTRIQSIPAEFFEKQFPIKVPFGETYREVFAFMLYHEADHIGQMKAMKRLI